MGAAYALLGLGIGIGIAINEALRWRLENGRTRHRVEPGSGPRRWQAVQSAGAGHSSHSCWRFSAQDYYDR